MKKKTYQAFKVAFLLMGLITVASVAALAVFLLKGDNRKQHRALLSAQQQQLAALKVSNENYARVLQADDFFMLHRDHDKAIRAYLDLLPQLDAGTAKMVEQRIAHLKAMRDQAVATGPAPTGNADAVKLKRALDSLRIRNRELQHHEQHLMALVKRKDSLAAHKAAVPQVTKEAQPLQVISFKSETGKTVHYLGEVSNGKANGGGTGIWTTGSMYRGSWRNNKRHGQGEYTGADGMRYVGEFKDNKRDGEGTYYWPSGERYEGAWKNDIREGYGLLYDQDGNIRFKGIWKDDKPNKEASAEFTSRGGML